jgi:heme-degrading monooxygenase HmoA
LEPLESHGFWDGKKVFGELPNQSDYSGKIAVLTRATIKLSKLKHFWKNVASVASQMATAKGFITSYGVGEIPWIKQATFSIWESKEDMMSFAYKMPQHKEVIKKTVKQKWYKEEMFTRFKILEHLEK